MRLWHLVFSIFLIFLAGQTLSARRGDNVASGVTAGLMFNSFSDIYDTDSRSGAVFRFGYDITSFDYSGYRYEDLAPAFQFQLEAGLGGLQSSSKNYTRDAEPISASRTEDEESGGASFLNLRTAVFYGFTGSDISIKPGIALEYRGTKAGDIGATGWIVPFGVNGFVNLGHDLKFFYNLWLAGMGSNNMQGAEIYYLLSDSIVLRFNLIRFRLNGFFQGEAIPAGFTEDGKITTNDLSLAVLFNLYN